MTVHVFSRILRFTIKHKRTFSLIFLCCLSSFYVEAQNDRPEQPAPDTARIVTLDSVVITGSRLRRNNTYQYTLNEIKPLVTVLGEQDVLRYIGTLPGVSQGMEGGLGFFVRGSNSGNNRFTLDDVPVYGNTHLFGLFSVFSPDIVENVNFFSGKLPASSGDFLSSLTQISSKNPDTESYHGNFSISPFLVGANLTGDLVKNKLSFQVAGRYSLLSQEIRLLESMLEMEGDIVPEMADLYVKLHYRPHANHTLNASGYYSNDYFKFENSNFSSPNFAENWGNKIFRLSWNWSLSDSLQLNTMAYYNRFFTVQKQQMFNNNVLDKEFRMQTALNEQALHSTLNYQMGNRKVAVGLQSMRREIYPASRKIYTGNRDTESNNVQSVNPPSSAVIITAFGDYEYKYKSVTASAGIRESYYRIHDYHSFDNNIHLALSIELSKKNGLELSYDRFSQFYHVLEGLPVGWNLDLMIPSDKQFQPEKAQQFYVGGFQTIQQFFLSLGAYYKNMKNLASYKNPANIFSIQDNWRDEVINGKGTSYGLEFRGERSGEDWNASLSYSLSKTDRLFKEINNGEKFPFKFDRRHILNFTGQIRTRQRQNGKQYFSLSSSFSSGHNITVPIAMYMGVEPPFWSWQLSNDLSIKEQENAMYRQLMSDVNGYSLPYYLRIDVGYGFLHTWKYFTSECTIGVFNVLNRQNPYLLFYDEGQWKQLSIFPLIPSIKWSLEF
ncbi:MAG: TonB-dependent receptor plug domain-containing protein [Dysgonamonadaceae bacterium]|jgi:hypothetical protein|nr:TonB-dependent receptor plug domain-containing protein [Dysgonamonadaceae bacterium]